MTEIPTKILLVEDNPGDAFLLCQTLKKSAPGAEVKHVETLADAVSQLAQGGHDVLLLDLGLPDSQGLDTVRRISTHAAQIPVIVFTGTDDEVLGDEALHLGAQDYLVKGQVDGRLLARAMRYASQRKAVELQLRQAHDELELRVKQRTAELEEAITALGDEVSERTHMDEERREIEGLLRKLSEIMPYVLWIVNVDTGKAVYVNTAFERVFGLPCDEMYRDYKSWRKMLHPEDRKDVEAALDNWHEKGGWRITHSLFVDFRIIRSDGDIRRIHGQGLVIVGERDTLRYICGIFDDVTAKAGEALNERKTSALG